MLPPKTMVASAALLAASLIAASAAQAQTVWYVNDDGDTGNGCTSWEDACPELQKALSLAEAGDQIWVATGTYKPDYDVNTGQHTGDREATFQLISGVETYGGFDGMESSLEERAGLFDQTILSGDVLGDDDPDGPGGSGSDCCIADETPSCEDTECSSLVCVYWPSCCTDEWSFDCAEIAQAVCCLQCSDNITHCENSVNVVTGSGTDGSAILDGFTIAGGNAYSPNDPFGNGGGMLNNSGSPTVANCTFSGNSANSGGGGMANFNSSHATVANCTFSGNSAEAGGGMSNYNSSHPTVGNCTFSGNSAGSGGGMSNGHGSNPAVTNCVFAGNLAIYGGGMYSTHTSLKVTNCTFSGNHAISKGGGVYLSTVVSPAVTNCTFSWNSAGSSGGGILKGNTTGSLAVTNCILWENWPTQIVGSLGTTVSYSDVQGGYSGQGNVNADPLFVDADGPDGAPGTLDDDLRLLATSPCIDAADNTAVPPDETDLDGDGDTDEPIPFDVDGNPRFIDDPWSPDTGAGDCPMVDMGAYEFQDGSADCCPADFDGDGAVGAADLAELLGSWGPCEGCPADLDGDGTVGAFDLALLLGGWGACE